MIFQMRMAPVRRQIFDHPSHPGAIVENMVAGALYSSLGQQLGHLFLREFRPQRQGRHNCHPIP